MVSMRKDVLSDSVKRFVETRKEELDAFFTISLGIRSFEISCCDYRTPGKVPCSRLNYLYTGLFPGKLFPILDQNYRISIPYGKLNWLKKKTILLKQHIPI